MEFIPFRYQQFALDACPGIFNVSHIVKDPPVALTGQVINSGCCKRRASWAAFHRGCGVSERSQKTTHTTKDESDNPCTINQELQHEPLARQRNEQRRITKQTRTQRRSKKQTRRTCRPSQKGPIAGVY
jgi:hypothetical protein